jgi:nucleotide sugar dehydrogenase
MPGETTNISLAEIAERENRPAPETGRAIVCIQGLGFVGFAMAVAVASARDAEGRSYFNVIGVDLPNAEGCAKVQAINQGRSPVVSNDEELSFAFAQAFGAGNLIATTDPEVYAVADITVVDVHLDLAYQDGRPSIPLDGFRKAIATLGTYMKPGSLIVVETTVPPGTCAAVAAPELALALERRGLPPDSIRLAHSYERVMPGKEYYSSIVNFWRVYAGHTPAAADACESFLAKVINVEHYPLTRLHSTTASETAKVLENSYRAANIAFIEEWARFAETVGIDLFQVVEAIRMRPTHSNMRQPGFGVGGYCLTKDPLFAAVAAREIFGRGDLSFPFSSRAVQVNAQMPLRTLELVRQMLGGSLVGKRLLLLGVSYRNDVGDTRHSPSEVLVRDAEAEGAIVECHDPLVRFWPEMMRELPASLPSVDRIDAVIFAVAHEEYTRLDVESWLGEARPVVFDANHVLNAAQRSALHRLGCRVTAIGNGCLAH